MNNTYQILLHWDKGQPFSERLAAKILAIEGYEEIDPQSPTGGPDGQKDILCSKDEKKYVAGCYFPNGQKTLSEIKEKFNGDYAGKERNKADGFIFITNQKITPSERVKLCENSPNSEIYHGEKVWGVLDSPKGYGIRLEYLGIELSKAEQISFLHSHLDLKESYEEIKKLLAELKKTTSRIAGYIDDRDIGSAKTLCTIPIAGIQFSSRMSVEDLFALHRACLYEGGGAAKALALEGFRKVQVWIGFAGASPDKADFIPPSPEEVPTLINELLKWWRDKYMDVLYADNSQKIAAIAEFHEKFLSIHPFLDGNGRVVRVLSSLQYKDLIGEEITFEKIENISDYYLALQAARSGSPQQLVDIFMALTK